MRREKLFSALHSILLSFLLSFGGVGCMITGLELPVSNPGIFAFGCGLASLLGSLIAGKKGNRLLLAVILLLPVPFLLLHDGTLAQTESMLRHISTFYDNAYGIGVLCPGAVTAVMDIPLLFIGIWVALICCMDIRGQSGWMDGKAAALLPLAACVVVTDTVPKPVFLYLWALGMVLLVLTGGTRRRNRVQGIYLTHIAAVPAAIALALLFLAFPQEEYDKHPEAMAGRIAEWVEEIPTAWDDFKEQVSSRLDGVIEPERVDLKNLGPRLKRVYPVMEVETPAGGTLYLRGQDFDTYTGTGWTSDSSREEIFSYLRSLDLLEVTFPREAGVVRIRTNRKLDVLYIPYYPIINITLSGGRLDNTAGLKEYSYSQTLLPETWRAVVGADNHSTLYRTRITERMPDRTGQPYLQLPEGTYAGAAEILLGILTDENTATEVADTVAAFVRDCARYDLNTKAMPAGEEDFALWFLYRAETGYCVHFATAATVLLRAAGVEARYVEGYMVTAAAGETVTVTADKAHAWVEYYEPLLDAWIPLEATPPDLSAPETVPATVPGSEPVTETEEDTFHPSMPPEGPTGSREETVPGEVAPEPEKPGEEGSNGWLWLFTPALLWGLLELQRILRIRTRRNAGRRGKFNRRLLAVWGELELLERRLGEEPPRELRLLAEKAKYSPHRITPEELAVMREAVSGAEERLRQRPWYLRLIDRYIFSAY